MVVKRIVQVEECSKGKLSGYNCADCRVVGMNQRCGLRFATMKNLRVGSGCWGATEQNAELPNTRLRRVLESINNLGGQEPNINSPWKNCGQLLDRRREWNRRYGTGINGDEGSTDQARAANRGEAQFGIRIVQLGHSQLENRKEHTFTIPVTTAR